MTEDFFHQLGLKLTTIIAGVIGGLISLSYHKQLTWYRAIFMILIGGVTAGYTTPLIAMLFNLGETLENSMAFILGLLGMKITTAIISLIEKLAQDPSYILDKIRGR